MGKALLNRDIFLEIVEYLPKSSLAALACTSKVLCDAALDGLWREMDSLDPLYRCLPSGVWMDFREQLVLAGAPVQPNDWLRFISYANRICRLSLNESAQLRLDFLKVIKYHLPRGVAVFQRLKNLRLVRNSADSEFFLGLSILLHPGLQAVDLSATLTDCVVATLSYMQTRCPDIQELSITKAIGVMPMIDYFAQLRILVYDSPQDVVDLHLIFSLAHLPHLRALKITARFAPDPLGTSSSTRKPHDQAFPALEELSLDHATSLQAVSHLLRLITSPTLRLFSLAYGLPDRKPAGGDLRDLSTGLSRHQKLGSLSLRSLQVPDDAVQIKDLGGLTELKCLTDVHLTDILSHKSMSAAGIAVLTHSWSRLCTLHIICKPWHDDRAAAKVSVPNISVLSRLAANCPCLQELRVAIEATRFSQPLDVNTPGERCENPLHLLLCSASALENTPEHAYDVAEYISDTYPRVDLSYEGPQDGARWKKYGAQWGEVKKLVMRMSRTRAMERRRIELEMLKLVEGVSQMSSNSL
ncbi:uncharacterized protein PHACADRAFT_113023 [Phanerochaete carnosa HHB-10118-sp]|uniref:F-box domain-containing protein n=1 Tax=Phanerochaete carnosa (strain HHB-10118-sp) TaxID=650164 RepID=K5V828_PHACS|nr:uncharacterized protein PHACADRAFT_113023 [Phanerochaete carnosa HHB-10118-sp]EKM58926.1 hypothetical protein PHACADRAFT_113023 [Phanerochaete carnosa HHB-10118-sp]